ncbi:hypothetical protein [Roseomonas indoligenes]|uniref:Serine kinase n=1 Tax=Roseomonas indoligenes TaxID=2820811 RepID=A0A940N1F8_9PROT|nr:hypothetical protein [Pararoseomonas indoligenes]MBP0495017.1 hypothetical protein [Pararoseomonas indoligenes]
MALAAADRDSRRIASEEDGSLVAATIAAAAEQPAVQARQVAIGSLKLRLHFLTHALAAMFAGAFAAAPEDGAGGESWELTVADGSCGMPPPALVPPDRDGDMLLHADAESYILWMGRHAQALYAVDRRRRRALYWVEDAARVPAWERSRPFLPILQAMLDGTPWIAVHGAAIAWQGRAVLLAGPGRAGKTSLALAGLAAGWRFAGDDFVLVRTDASPEVAALYATARLRDDMLGRFGALEPARREISFDDGERRHELAFNTLPGPLAIGGAPLAAVLLLDRRGAAKPVFAPVTRTALLNALAATTAVATPGHEPARMGKLLNLLAAPLVPRRFDPGRDFAAALAALAEAVA